MWLAIFADALPFFQWESPDDPSTPFAAGLFIFDLIRVAVIAMCFAIALLSFGSLFKPGGTLGQKARLAGTGIVFALYVAGTEFEHLGDFAHWRLYAGLFASVMALWGLWSYFKFEKPAAIRPYGQE